MSNNPEPMQSLGGGIKVRQKFKNMNEFAEFCFPNGASLRCKSCRASRHCPTSEIAKFMSEGYPVCRKCGVKTFLE